MQPYQRVALIRERRSASIRISLPARAPLGGYSGCKPATSGAQPSFCHSVPDERSAKPAITEVLLVLNRAEHSITGCSRISAHCEELLLKRIPELIKDR